MTRVVILLVLCFTLCSAVTLRKKHRHHTTNLCQKPAVLMNWGRGLPLGVANTVAVSGQAPTSSDIVLDTVTKDWNKYPTFCVSNDIFIQSFDNSLCLGLSDGKVVGQPHCELLFESVPANFKEGGYVRFVTTLASGERVALSAHETGDSITLEPVLGDEPTVTARAFQMWNVHYPQPF